MPQLVMQTYTQTHTQIYIYAQRRWRYKCGRCKPHIHVMSAEETVGKMFVLAQLCGTTVQLGRQELLLGPIGPSYSSSSYSCSIEDRKKTHFYPVYSEADKQSHHHQTSI